MAEETYHRAEVRGRRTVSPHLVRLRLGPRRSAGGAEPWSVTGSGVPDERLVLVLPAARGAEPVRRCYTVRARDDRTGELDLDVVLHEGGTVAAWAQRVEPGTPVLVGDPLGWYGPPAGTAWQLLVADLTGLPALSRIVETTAAALPTHTLVEVPEAADRSPLPGAASSTWLVGSGHGHTPGGLPAALHGFAWPDGPGYVWSAGECGDARAVRRHLRHGLGWSSTRYRVLGYWRIDQQGWDARYARLAPGLEQVYTDAVARGQSSTDALEAYDDALDRVGL